MLRRVLDAYMDQREHRPSDLAAEAEALLADGVRGTLTPVPVFRMELAAGDRYELRQLPDFGSLPEGEYVLHATPAAEDGVKGSVKPGDCIHCGKEICNDLGWCNSFKAAPKDGVDVPLTGQENKHG